MVMAAK